MSNRDARFAQLMREHGAALGRVVASYARPADQDDLAQEVSLGIWKALPAFRGDCSERTFVFRIAHNRGISYLARKRLRGEELPELVDGAPGPEAQAERRQQSESLFRALRTLPVPFRQALTLALEGMSNAEVGACLGITAETAAVRLSRARAALRAQLEER